jgi:hypothetical protein
VARRKKIDVPIAIPTGPEKVVPFGWCMTGHHGGCVVTFTGHRCSCECHGKAQDDGIGEVHGE